MLEDVYKSFRSKADEVNWKNYNQNELFYEYIKHENDHLAEHFYAGIVCRYWGYTGRLYIQCAKHIPFEECYDILIDSINYVLRNRVWENKDSSLYGDFTAPDKAFHIALKRQRSITLSKLNASIRKSNFNTLSIDQAHEDYSDSADGLFFNLESSEYDSIRPYIMEFFDRGEIFDGLILDIICYSHYDEYSLKKIVKELKYINMGDYNYYRDVYNVDETLFKNELKNIKYLTNKYIKIKINSLLKKVRRDIVDD